MASQLAVGVGAAVAIGVVVGLGTAALVATPVRGATTVTPSAGDPGGATVERAASGIPQCDNYRTMPGDAYGYCLYKIAGGLPDVPSVERVCGLAEEWEDECRHAWVAGKMNEDSPYDMQTLLDLCGTNADCAFELLDFRPAERIDDQLERCRLHAGKHAADCTGHAMQRWWHQGVDADEVARVAALPTAFPRKIGFWIAASVQCGGVGTCEGNEAVKAACEGQVESFTRKPNQCPSTTKAPLQPGSKPAAAVAGRNPGTPGGQGGPVASGPATPGDPPATGGPGTPPDGQGAGPKTPTPPRHHTPGTIPSGLPPRPR